MIEQFTKATKMYMQTNYEEKKLNAIDRTEDARKWNQLNWQIECVFLFII